RRASARRQACQGRGGPSRHHLRRRRPLNANTAQFPPKGGATWCLGPRRGWPVRVAVMDLSLTDEEREIRDWVRTFVTREVMPLEQMVLERERRNEPGLTLEELRELQ